MAAGAASTDPDDVLDAVPQLSTHLVRPRPEVDTGAMTEPSTPQPGRFLTLTDVAEVLALTAAEVVALVRSGELPAIRLGAIGQWRVEHAVLESFIADKYDEARRMALWNEAQSASVTELFGERRGRR